MPQLLGIKHTQSLTGSYDLVSDLGATAKLPIAMDQTVEMTSGVGLLQADRYWDNDRTLAASATEDLDLAGGLTDIYGVVLTFVKIKGIWVKAASTNTNDVVVGGAAANAFLGPFASAAHQLKVAPGATLALIHPGAGWTVTAATGDLLRIGNGGVGTSVDYQIAIFGTSA